MISRYLPPFFLKSICFSLLQAVLLTALFLLLNVCLALQIQFAFWLCWFPLLGSLVFWLTYYGGKIGAIKTKADNFVLQVLAIAFFALPSAAFYLVASDLAIGVKRVPNAHSIDYSLRNTAWVVDSIDFEDRYGTTFESVTDSKNATRDFKAVVVSRIQTPARNLWLVTRSTSFISRRASGYEIGNTRDANYNRNLQKELWRITYKKGPVCLVPIAAGGDAEDAKELLKMNNLPVKAETRFYEWKLNFKPGVSKSSCWILAISLTLTTAYFFVLGRRTTTASSEPYTVQFFQFVRTYPMTTLLLLYWAAMLVLSICREPNLFQVRLDSTVVDFMVWKDVKRQWYRIFTAPFADVSLLLRVIGVAIVVSMATLVEKYTTKTGFAVLTLAAIISTGVVSLYFSKAPCYGLHAIYICYAAWYCTRADLFKRTRKGWEMEGSLYLWVGILVYVVASFVPDNIDFPRLAASIGTGMLLAVFVRASKPLP